MDCKASTHNHLECMLLDASAEPRDLPISLLKDITKDFSDDQQIGRGGFAVVYKGLLQNGTVAVKKLFNALEMDDDKFIKEVTSLMRVKHKNIVRFLGYCADTQGKMWNYEGKMIMAEERRRLLCFEFLPKGSLDKYITDISEGLEWRTRYQIIKGICEGLHYLHQNNIVHLDLKPANVLLNDDMVPKLADFGLSRCFHENQSKDITKNLVGSQGYLAPEFGSGLITFKSDIYSLGVIIIEILTGQKASPEIDNVLQGWSTRFKTSGDDKWLEQVRVCAKIGIKCIHDNREERPLTGLIIEMLAEMESKHGFTQTDPCTSSVAHEEKGSSELRYGIPKVPGGTSSEICSLESTEISKLLEVYPSELRFPFEPNPYTEQIQCPVNLINRTDQYVGVWIRQTNLDTRSGLQCPFSLASRYLATQICSWFSLIVILDPHSTLVVSMTLLEEQPPPHDPAKFEVLMIVMGSEADLKKLSTIGRLNLDSDFLKGVEKLGGEVHRAMLTAAVICDPASCQEMIRNQKEFIPETLEPIYGNIVCIDVHPTETWILMGHMSCFIKEDGTYIDCANGYVSIWNYETQEIVTVLQVIKDPGRLNQACSIHLAKFIAREQWFATGDDDGCVHVNSYTTKDKVKKFEAHKSFDSVVLAVHPTDPFLLTGSHSDTWIKLWDWSKGWACTHRFNTHSDAVLRLMFNPRDRHTFASFSRNGKLKVA